MERRGLRDAVYDRILDQLLRGETEAGGRLSIETLARELSVSATPVREALVQLERTGLVTREALRGYRVARRWELLSWTSCLKHASCSRRRQCRWR